MDLHSQQDSPITDTCSREPSKTLFPLLDHEGVPGRAPIWVGCHGLPVEFEMEKTLELKGRGDVEEYGIDRFNEACRDIVLRYTGEWRTVVERLGRWVDFENEYKTMDLEFMESVWSVFKTLWDKGLIYEGFRVVPYSWRVGAPCPISKPISTTRKCKILGHGALHSGERLDSSGMDNHSMDSPPTWR